MLRNIHFQFLFILLFSVFSCPILTIVKYCIYHVYQLLFFIKYTFYKCQWFLKEGKTFKITYITIISYFLKKKNNYFVKKTLLF